MNNAIETAEYHEHQARECERRKEESFERCDTDGFLSQWSSGLVAEEHRTKARIIREGGDTFASLLDAETGRRIAAKVVYVDDRYSYHEGAKKPIWLLRDDEVAKYGRKWVPYGCSSRVQKQLGLTQGLEHAPAYAKIVGVGRGLSGQAWVATFRVHDRDDEASEWELNGKEVTL